jgi:hypothetical protein
MPTQAELTARHAELTAQIASAAPGYGAEVHAQAAWAAVHFANPSDARSWLRNLSDHDNPQIADRAAKALTAYGLFDLATASKKAA